MKKEYRIKKTTEIESIIKFKHVFGNKYFTVYIKNSETSHFRCALSVGKKIGKPVVRVHIKRQIRSIVRENNQKLQAYDIFIVAKPLCLELDYKNKKKQLEYIFKKLNIVKEK